MGFGKSIHVIIIVTFVNELLETMSNGIETDVIALDLSKAFYTVPHRRLMEKLKF